MIDLIAKIEAVEMGSRELDGEIFKTIIGPLFDATPSPFGISPYAIWGISHGPRPVPSYTTSLDAITALIADKLPGYDYGSERTGPAFFCRMWKIGQEGEPSLFSFASAEPLARCAALLRALEIQKPAG